MRCVFWIGILLLVFVGASQAAPMDSPDTIYIDGQPCNSFCQSYMAWSRAVSKGMAQAAPRSAKRRVARVREARPHERVAKHSAPGHPALGHAALGVKETAHVAHVEQEPPAPNGKEPPSASSIKEAPLPPSLPDAPPSVKQEPPSQVATAPQVDNAAPQAEPATKPAGGNSSPKTGLPETTGTVTPAAEAKATRPVREQVIAAAAVAERLSTEAASSEAASSTESGKPDSAAPNDGGRLVALVMSRPEIKSVADLTGANVAIDQGHSLSQTNVRTALVVAGATDVQLSAEDSNAIDRLVNGEVPAAVVALVSAEAAQAFPDIAGFRIFRLPLSPRS
jgi:hypothetical protein